MVDEICKVEERGGGFEDLYPLIAGERMKQAWEDGDVDVAPMMVGQSIGLIHDIPTCEELLETMVKEARKQLEEVSRKFEN